MTSAYLSQLIKKHLLQIVLVKRVFSITVGKKRTIQIIYYFSFRVRKDTC